MADFLIRRYAPLFVLLVLSACAGVPSEPMGPYRAPANEAAAVDQLLAEAAATDRLAVIVLGANWCHDSKAFAKTIASPEVAPIMEAGFAVTLMDVGWFERGRATAQRYGMAVPLHTPTVLVVDPESGALLNAHDHQIFRDAAKLSSEDVRTYFADKARGDNLKPDIPAAVAMNPEYRRLMAEIAAFEARQGDRIAAAYGRLGPMLRDNAPQLNATWAPVRDLRYALADDLLRLRTEAAQRVAQSMASEEGTITLTYPDYSPFPWEAL